jgi:SAM-dependent methyltransferase
VRLAADLGCGPGEITCELARRHPDVRFVGIDHSRAAIERARGHAGRLGLANVTFETGDIARPLPPPRPDLILMFDAFHHLLDPAAFVRDSGVDRFLLVEPAGTWSGGWQRTLDLDWLPIALDDIRARLAWEIGDAAGAAAHAPASEPAGEAIEHRYPLDDFTRFFAGYGLDVRGTVAGFDRYPADPHAQLPMRAEIGRSTYEAVAGIDEALVARNLDLHAKHWVIRAERGAPDRLRDPAPLHRTADPPRLQGACDVEYVSLDAPSRAARARTITATLTFRNRSWRTLESPVFASYHWIDPRGALIVEDGARTPFPRPVPPGETCTMALRIDTPPAAGRYTLAVDLVEENVTWFSAAGVPPLRRAMTIA